MNSNNETENLIYKAASDVMMLARNTLLVNMRFLDIALNRLEPAASDEAMLATDGAHIIYGPKHVLRLFKSDHDRPARDYLHVILHCVFSHMFVGKLVDRELWDLACDIAVETAINDLDLRITGTERKKEQRPETERLKSAVDMLTVEKIYHFFLENGLTESERRNLRKLFSADDHSVWYSYSEASSGERDRGKGDGRDSSQEDPENPDREDDRDLGPADHVAADRYMKTEYEFTEDDEPPGSAYNSIEDEWRKIAEKIQEDMETFSREHGDAAGGLMQNLREVNREKYDYASFLKKFAVLGEIVTVNDEEFDYIFYTYGLEMYGNMPLVEPLEYKEVKRVREFVIAIDTSGSTAGELVQRFLQKTYNILKSTESYFSRVNIHIIQCDTAIQEHVKITTEQEFDDYIRTMSIHGLGGTDFRPVFTFVDDLIGKGEFTDLRGLIYFTDGYGVFPPRKPVYETAFVFLDNAYNNREVPPWAIRLMLQDEEI